MAVTVTGPLLPVVDKRLLALFSRYTKWLLKRNFHALRVDTNGLCSAALSGSPLIIYCNHPSWWDPLICLWLSQNCLPGRRNFAAIDSVALEQYRFFARLGFFGVEKGSPRGLRQLLKACREAFEDPSAAVWLTPEGAFTDVRKRPLRFLPGLGQIGRIPINHTYLPLAIELVFGFEKQPEVLCRIGMPIPVESLPEKTVDRLQILEAELEGNLDHLASIAIERDWGLFDRTLKGRSSVDRFYDIWLRLRAVFGGRKPTLSHGSLSGLDRK